MIKFSLRCAADHRFDSWFASADAYDSLHAAGRLACAVCGGGGVVKALMAPAVAPAREPATPPAVVPPRGGSHAMPSAEIEAALRELRRRIEAESDYVGDGFAREARAIHDGLAPERSIWGEANGADVRALLEDGVPVAPLPFLPTRKVN
jgi:hypothetical protein